MAFIVRPAFLLWGQLVTELADTFERNLAAAEALDWAAIHPMLDLDGSTPADQPNLAAAVLPVSPAEAPGGEEGEGKKDLLGEARPAERCS